LQRIVVTDGTITACEGGNALGSDAVTAYLLQGMSASDGEWVIMSPYFFNSRRV
jgi:hypothetical protein